MQRWIANLLMGWMLLLVPGATALELAQPQILLPACCRIQGAHHCSMGHQQNSSAPAWRGTGCPFAHLQHAALLLPPFLPAAQADLVRAPHIALAGSTRLFALAAFLAGLPGSRAPPSLA